MVRMYSYLIEEFNGINNKVVQSGYSLGIKELRKHARENGFKIHFCRNACVGRTKAAYMGMNGNRTFMAISFN